MGALAAIIPFDTIGVRDCYYVKSERDYWVKVARAPNWTDAHYRASSILSAVKMATALIDLLVCDAIGTFCGNRDFCIVLTNITEPHHLGMGGQAELYSTERLTGGARRECLFRSGQGKS